MRRRPAFIRHEGISVALGSVCLGLFPSLDPVCVAGDILRLGFLVQRDAHGEESVRGKLRADGGGGALVSVEFEEVEEGF